MTTRPLLALALALGLATPAQAETLDGSRITVLDGDTVALPCAAPGPGCAERVRIANIDTPEIFHPDCDWGLQLGLAAKDRLKEILAGHPVTLDRWAHKDVYGRTLATLSTPEGDVGRLLIAEHYALPWAYGYKAKAWRIRQWCGRP